MKRVLICSIVGLFLLSLAGVGSSQEKPRRERAREGAKLTEAEKKWRQELQAMTPQQRQVAMAKKNLENELASWQEVRKIALSENATKTVAAIDKIVVAKQEAFKKKLAAQEKRQAGPQDREKGRDKGKAAEGQNKPRGRKKQPQG